MSARKRNKGQREITEIQRRAARRLIAAADTPEVQARVRRLRTKEEEEERKEARRRVVAMLGSIDPFDIRPACYIDEPFHPDEIPPFEEVTDRLRLRAETESIVDFSCPSLRCAGSMVADKKGYHCSVCGWRIDTAKLTDFPCPRPDAGGHCSGRVQLVADKFSIHQCIHCRTTVTRPAGEIITTCPICRLPSHTMRCVADSPFAYQCDSCGTYVPSLAEWKRRMDDFGGVQLRFEAIERSLGLHV